MSRNSLIPLHRQTKHKNDEKTQVATGFFFSPPATRPCLSVEYLQRKFELVLVTLDTDINQPQ